MTSTAVGQGFGNSAERSTGRRGSQQVWTTNECEAWSHSTVVILEQGPISRAQYDTRDIYEGRIYQQYGHDD